MSGAQGDILGSYKVLYNCLDDDLEISVMALLPLMLANSGDIDGALVRLEAIMSIQKENGKISHLTRHLYGLNKLLKGDMEPWLALEKEASEAASNKAAAKNKKKTAARKAKAKVIKAEVEAKQQQKVQKEKYVQVVATVPVVSSAVSGKGKEEADEVAFVPSGDFKTLAQQQAEQLARHEANEKKRNTSAVAPATKPAMIEVVEDAEPEQPVTRSISLAEFYQLKGVPKRVDEEIETGTWRISRDQLKTYFKAVGCEYRSGKGIHEKLTLPKEVGVDIVTGMAEFQSTYLMKGDRMITIFINVGGALTLPSWEKGYLPDYLRPQILAARERLRDTAGQVQKEVECHKDSSQPG